MSQQPIKEIIGTRVRADSNTITSWLSHHMIDQSAENIPQALQSARDSMLFLCNSLNLSGDSNYDKKLQKLLTR
jgi:hypothetical protein